ncbi:hypothetical protein ACMFMF_002689 [Clarireedia jacksonii]
MTAEPPPPLTFNPILYNPLNHGEVRFLSLEPSSYPEPDDDAAISCQMRPVKLKDLCASATKFGKEHENKRQWHSSKHHSYNYTSLFKPRWGLFDRPLKRYIQSLEENQAVVLSETSPHLSDRYVALSYVWGTPADKKTIIVNGVEIQITQNLHAALLELRRSTWVRRGVNLWIDALCINQDDLDEREQQVKLMREIYAMAWQVVIFLGPETSTTSAAYTSLKWLAHEIGSDSKLREFAVKYGTLHHNTAGSIESAQYTLPWHEGTFQALRSFFARQYWHRLWILQEVAMAKLDAPVLWGSYSMCLGDIWKACQIIERQEDTILQYMTTHSSDIDPTRTVATVDRRLEDREGTPGQQWKHILRIRNMRNTNQTGIPCVQGLCEISPNYRVELREVYINFTRGIISNNDHGLDILRLIHSHVGRIMLSSMTANNPAWMRKIAGGRLMEVTTPCSHDLPSWVVCWSCTSAPTIFLPGLYRADAGFTHPTRPRLTANDGLSVHATFIDSVVTLSAFNAAEIDNYPKSCVDVSSIPNSYSTIDGLKEAFWKTIVADSTPTGEKPPLSWAVLRLPYLWSIFGTSEGGGSGLSFGLYNFAERNKEFSFCGTRLKDLLADAKTIRERKTLKDEKRSTSDEDLRDASSWAANVLAWRRLMGTKSGRIGITAAAAVIGDSIVVLPGCSVPFVLRRQGTSWKVIGECFVYGLMDGEAATMVGCGKASVVDIQLR